VTVDICCAKVLHHFIDTLILPFRHQTKNNVLKKQNRYDQEFKIMLSSEMLVWNCFRLLTFTNIYNNFINL